jgi:hypothetical protein
MEGAIAAVCDRCFDSKAEILWACAGPCAKNNRVPIGSLIGEHKHDLAKHALLKVGHG